MKLPDDFQLSQASMQDFADCRRRFLLRHIWRLAWPAIQTEPAHEHEHYLQQGAAFHRYAQQFFLGIPAERLAATIKDPQLMDWWANFSQLAGELKEHQLVDGWKLLPETSISATLAGVRMVAKYDLVAATPQGRLLIYDWKTSHAQPRRQWLDKRLQTRVYPYLLTRVGQHLNDHQPVQPEQVEMVYWFTNHPAQSVNFPYSTAAYQEDEAYLRGMIETILRSDESEFHLTADESRCAFCTYRSLCDRGISAGSLSDLQREFEDEDEDEINLDFEQIAEIEF
jgi:RecB family exonuclease